jgi:hypothetical protein
VQKGLHEEKKEKRKIVVRFILHVSYTRWYMYSNIQYGGFTLDLRVRLGVNFIR